MKCRRQTEMPGRLSNGDLARISNGLQPTQEATALGAPLSAWHDAMVAHERRLRSAVTSNACVPAAAKAIFKLL
jgi:hypothetical protein